MSPNDRSRRPTSLRTRFLAAALAPGLVMLLALGLVGYGPLREAIQRHDRAAATQTLIGVGSVSIPPAVAERNATFRYVGSPTPENRRALEEARVQADVGNAEVAAGLGGLVQNAPEEIHGPLQALGAVTTLRITLRQQVDAGQLDLIGVHRGFLASVASQHYGSLVLSSVNGDGTVVNRAGRGGDLLKAAQLLGQPNSMIASAMLGDGLTQAEVAEFNRTTGAYQDLVEAVSPLLEPSDQAALGEIRAGQQWRTIQAAAAVLSGPDPLAESNLAAIDPVQLAEASRAVEARMTDLGLAAVRSAQVLESDNADAVLRTAVVTSIAVLAIVIAALVIAATVTTRLIRRLRRLRRETLRLADGTLPEVVARLRRGERIDLDREVPELNHGRDEIGQVAAAFNQAQRTAVQAAVDEAHTRAGFNSAFLNIARRSQAILHQQMEVLDRVERHESDPDQLELLFRLDHLATRERRNAENLIILGGEQPRRQWRKPVALVEVVRGAVGEAEDYQRVTVRRLPGAMIAGPAVGDLLHLLAELVDNATAFSPPGSPIEVHGTIVGRGVVVEVEDQGLGIEPSRLDELNDLLRNPPDFSLLTLSEDSRIGLFVVAWLARKHGVTVHLRPSVYGGVVAGVLVPTALLSGEEPQREPVGSPTGNGHTPAGHRSRTGEHAMPPTEAFDPHSPPPPSLPPQPMGPDSTLPALPQRNRQSHMDTRLREGLPPDPWEEPPVDSYSPEVARSRMSAFQRGTTDARRDAGGTNGSGRNGSGRNGGPR
jgi:signal transduction histidine kinase